jgi:hypothetical protein
MVLRPWCRNLGGLCNRCWCKGAVARAELCKGGGRESGAWHAPPALHGTARPGLFGRRRGEEQRGGERGLTEWEGVLAFDGS